MLLIKLRYVDTVFHIYDEGYLQVMCNYQIQFDQALELVEAVCVKDLPENTCETCIKILKERLGVRQ